MPRTSEIDHLALLLADLTIAAARAKTVESLARIRVELVRAHRDALTLVAHDASALPDPDVRLIGDFDALVDDLNARLQERDGAWA